MKPHERKKRSKVLGEEGGMGCNLSDTASKR